MALTVLAGCASNGASAPKETGQITVWHYYTSDSQLKNMAEKETAFKKSHPGVSFKEIFVPYDDMINKLIAAAQTKTGPDLIIGDGANAQALVDAGAIKPMTTCEASWKTASDIVPGAFRKVDNKLYGVLPYLNLIALWYNKDELDAAGLKPPTSLDELESELATLTSKGSKGLVFDGTPDFPGAWTAQPILSAMGVDYPDYKAASVTAALKQLATWTQKGWVPRDVAGYDQGAAFNEFLTGKYGFTINGNWNIAQAKTDAKFNYGVVPFPSGSGDSTVYVSGETAMLGAFSKNSSTACDYLGQEWFTKAGALQSLENIGSLPMLKSLSTDPAVTSNPLYVQFTKAASTGSPTPGGTQYQTLNTVVGPAFSQLLAGGDASSIGPSLVDGVKSALSK
jgi:multiple sugar transport system substrate-binding protein